MPKWLKREARKAWARKLEIYARRGQNVTGLEDALAQYCSLEGALISNFWRHGETPPASLLQAYMSFAARFYDTPGDQQRPVGKKENRFAGNGVQRHAMPARKSERAV